MTIKQVAEALGLKVRTIREWIRTGRIEARKKGKYWYIPEEAIRSQEVQERADKGREHSRRIKECRELGLLARGSEDTEKPV